MFALLINQVNTAHLVLLGKKELFLLWKQLDLPLNLSAFNITYITLSKAKLCGCKLQFKDFYVLLPIATPKYVYVTLSSRLTLYPAHIMILNNIEGLVSRVNIVEY